MSPKNKAAHEAASISELVSILGGEEQALPVIQKALKNREDQRLYHKKQYLRKQSILEKAKAAGITA